MDLFYFESYLMAYNRTEYINVENQPGLRINIQIFPQSLKSPDYVVCGFINIEHSSEVASSPERSFQVVAYRH